MPNKRTWLGWIGQRLFADEINRRVNLAVRALDDWRDRRVVGEGTVRDRRAYDREQVLADALEAWRLNPLARRIVELTSDYVVGSGLAIESDDPGTHAFLQEWWSHRLNRMAVRAFEWCDELTRSGELFPLLSTDGGGMTYVRAVAAADVEDIETAANDVEQELRYRCADEVVWSAYGVEEERDGDRYATVMLHYAVNRPVGALRGESDLAPLLKWLTRYSAWMEDRLRLNRFRQAFMYVVTAAFPNDAKRLERQAELNANPPNPGSVLVKDSSEAWEVLHPKLDSFEASADGLALKKLIAAGAGVPMHFLAEPEGSTRTTAEQSGGPTFRHYDRRQQFFLWVLSDIARIAVRRRALVDPKVHADAPIRAVGTDISVRDNNSLANAAVMIVTALVHLRDRGLIEDEELVRMAYKFAGEVVDVKRLLKQARDEAVTMPRVEVAR